MASVPIKVLDITTNIGCSNACLYCPQEEITRQYSKRSKVFSMSFETFKICLSRMPKDVELCFAGMSEPWLNKDCSSMVSYAYKEGHNIHVATTLKGMSLSDIDLLERLIFFTFRVHLPSKEQYEKITVDDNYLKLLDRIVNSKINATFHFHGTDTNPRIKSLYKNLGSRYLTWARAQNDIKVKDVPFPKKKLGRIACNEAFRFNELLPNGDVLLCCQDYKMDHILGNLLASDYDSLFTGSEFLKIIECVESRDSDVLCRWCGSAFHVNKFLKTCNSLRYRLDELAFAIRTKNLEIIKNIASRIIFRFSK